MSCMNLTQHQDGTQSSDSGIPGLPDVGESIDVSTLEQILEMDDDEDERDFSRSIVFGFFEQAEVTFGKMDKALYVHIPSQFISLRITTWAYH